MSQLNKLTENEVFLKARSQYILGEIASKCIENGVKFEVSSTMTVRYPGDQLECSGYFQGFHDGYRPNILAFGAGRPPEEWLVVALHESSHMDQFIEKAKVWTDCEFPDHIDATDYYFEWLADKNFELPEPIEKIAQRALMVELDCERRTLQKLYRYGLDECIDPVEYIKKSNSYVYFYLYMLESRRWSAGERAPYKIDDIWKFAPTTFDGDYSTIPEELLAAFRRNL